MHIDSYQFGEMVIDGKSFKSDLMLFPEKVKSDWWRQEGHKLKIDDLAGVIEAKPEAVVIGQGESGCLVVPEETREFLEKHKIIIITQRTPQAVRTYNQLAAKKRVVGLFHLTC